MKLKIAKKRRITLPLQLLQQVGLNEGDDAYIYIENNKLVISKYSFENDTTSYIDSELKSLTTECSVPTIPKNTSHSIQIVPNIQHISQYVKPIVSTCRLVVRSKRRYLNDFCDVCRGKLIEDKPNIPCKFKVGEPIVTDTKDVIQNIKHNTSILKEKLNMTILDISSDKASNLNDKWDNKLLEPVKSDGKLKSCTVCKEYYTKGFSIDGYFYCKDCAKKDFLKYLKQRKEGN